MMRFNFSLDIKKRHVFAILGMIFLVGFVIAQTPPNPGHAASQVGAGDLSGSYYSIPNGDLGVGVSGAIANSEGWGRVIDLNSNTASRLSVRTNNVDGRVLAHDTGWWGSPAGGGMIVGTGNNRPLSFATNGQTRMTVEAGGNVRASNNLYVSNNLYATRLRLGFGANPGAQLYAPTLTAGTATCSSYCGPTAVCMGGWKYINPFTIVSTNCTENQVYMCLCAVPN